VGVMLKLFENTSAVLNISKQLGKLRVDNGALKLHYRVTAPALFTASILVTAQQFIGDRISCIQSAGAIPEKVLNTYCFFVGESSVTTGWSFQYTSISVLLSRRGWGAPLGVLDIQ
jgi:Innexin